jgi:hypothetical protein
MVAGLGTIGTVPLHAVGAANIKISSTFLELGLGPKLAQVFARIKN